MLRPGQHQDGIELLGCPVTRLAEFISAAVGRRISKVLVAQDHLTDLDDPQTALHLLRSCLSLCKVNHLLQTVPPPLATAQWTKFDEGLRTSLGRITHTSIPASAWFQATLPRRLGGLGLRESLVARSAAYLGSCNLSRDLCFRLLGIGQGTITVLPGEEATRDSFRLSGVSHEDLNLDLHNSGQHILQVAVDDRRYVQHRADSSLRDKARLTACAAPHAAAWLRAIPTPSLGLTMSRHEFVLTLHLWLGVPVFPGDPSPQRCVCRQLLDPFGDHVLGCGHGRLRIKRHDALCEIIFHALSNDSSGVRMEQRCRGDRQSRPGDVFHPSFKNNWPAYFDITVCNTLQPGFLTQAAERPGVAAEAGVAAKDAMHEADVHASGGDFSPLNVESFRVWASSSWSTLRLIASRATTHTGLSTGRALQNLARQLSVLLWTYKVRLVRNHLTLAEDIPTWDLPA